MENNTQQSITVSDLDTLRNIVDLACTRGAFRGAELTQVGAIYDKLNQFLEAIIAQAKAQEEATADSNPDQSQGE
jgi:hypothetical protein